MTHGELQNLIQAWGNGQISTRDAALYCKAHGISPEHIGKVNDLMAQRHHPGHIDNYVRGLTHPSAIRDYVKRI